MTVSPQIALINVSETVRTVAGYFPIFLLGHQIILALEIGAGSAGVLSNSAWIALVSSSAF